MTDESSNPEIERSQTARNLLDLAFHKDTGDQEALAAIRAYNRIAKGVLPSILYESLYGDDADLTVMEDIWQERFAEQELEIARLRGELRRATKAHNEAKRRHQSHDGAEPAAPATRLPDEIPDLTITDQEWDLIAPFAPVRWRNDVGRVRIATMLVLLRTGTPWRVLATEEKPNGWTTFYNQYHQKWRHEQWWIDMTKALQALDPKWLDGEL